ncbi:hypothetical protein RKD18_000205 [Streptomyces phaeoluteigriseus]
MSTTAPRAPRALRIRRPLRRQHHRRLLAAPCEPLPGHGLPAGTAQPRRTPQLHHQPARPAPPRPARSTDRSRHPTPPRRPRRHRPPQQPAGRHPRHPPTLAPPHHVNPPTPAAPRSGALGQLPHSPDEYERSARSFRRSGGAVAADGLELGGALLSERCARDACDLATTSRHRGGQAGRCSPQPATGRTHQATFYSATAPAASFVAAILGHPRTLADVTDARPWEAADFGEEPRFLLRVGLLSWLGNTAWDANDESPDGYQADMEAFRALRPTLYDAIEPFLTDDEPAIRDAALAAVLPLLASPELTDQAEGLRDAVWALAAGSAPLPAGSDRHTRQLGRGHYALPAVQAHAR